MELNFGDETALKASISLGGAVAAGEAFRVFIATGEPNSPDLEISWTEVEGKSYHLRSSTSLGSDPLTWDSVEGRSELLFSASPLTIPRPLMAKTYFECAFAICECG